MDLINTLISSLAEASWPIAVVFLVLRFESEIRNIFKRIKKGKFFGQEFELEIDEFQNITEQAFEKLEVKPNKHQVSNSKALDKDIEEIMKVTAIKSELGVVALTPLLEREIRTLAESFEIPSCLSIRKLCELLVSKGHVPEQIIKSINLFFDLRNKIIHGHSKIEKPNDIIRVLDIGLQLFKIIRTIQHGNIAGSVKRFV